MQETTIVAFFEVSNCFNFRNACMKAHIRFQSFGKRESFAEDEGILESRKNLWKFFTESLQRLQGVSDHSEEAIWRRTSKKNIEQLSLAVAFNSCTSSDSDYSPGGDGYMSASETKDGPSFGPNFIKFLVGFKWFQIFSNAQKESKSYQALDLSSFTDVPLSVLEKMTSDTRGISSTWQYEICWKPIAW